MSVDNRIEVSELSEEQLLKSPTYQKYSKHFGRCLKCGEMANTLDPCCNRSISFEGGFLDADDLWLEIEQELSEQAEAQYLEQEEEE